MVAAQTSRLLLVSPAGPHYIPACCSTGSHFAQQQIRAHAPLPDLTPRHQPAWQLEQRRNSSLRPSCSCSKFRILPIPAQFQSLTDLWRRNSFSGRGRCPRPRSVRTPAYSQLYTSLMIGRCVGLLPVSDAWTTRRSAAVLARGLLQPGPTPGTANMLGLVTCESQRLASLYELLTARRRCCPLGTQTGAAGASDDLFIPTEHGKLVSGPIPRHDSRSLRPLCYMPPECYGFAALPPVAAQLANRDPGLSRCASMRVNSMSESVAAAAAEVSTAAIVRTILQPQRAREAGAGFSRGEAAAAPTRFALAQADAESDSSTTYSCCYPLSRRQLPMLGRMSERRLSHNCWNFGTCSPLRFRTPDRGQTFPAPSL